MNCHVRPLMLLKRKKENVAREWLLAFLYQGFLKLLCNFSAPHGCLWLILNYANWEKEKCW